MYKCLSRQYSKKGAKVGISLDKSWHPQPVVFQWSFRFKSFEVENDSLRADAVFFLRSLMKYFGVLYPAYALLVTKLLLSCFLLKVIPHQLFKLYLLWLLVDAHA